MKHNIYLPQISVIVPIYKVEKYIGRCAESLLEQSFDDIEYIFIDDCSPDNSIEVLNKVIDEYPQKKDKVTIYRAKQNAGQAVARNIGIGLARGEYIAFVDADDWVDKDLYNILYKNLKKENAQISCCGIERVCEEEHEGYFNDNLDLYKIFDDKSDTLECILDNSILTCSPCDKLFKSEIIKEQLFLEGMIFEDFEIMPRWLYKADKIIYTGKPLYFYRTNPISTMTTVTVKRLDEVRASSLRVAFYESKFPELAMRVKAQHFEICMNVLSCTVNAENSDIRRKRLLKYSHLFITFRLFQQISRRCKIKLLISLWGLKVFDCVVRICKK